jgi:hypothetical protein
MPENEEIARVVIQFVVSWEGKEGVDIWAGGRGHRGLVKIGKNTVIGVW